MATSKVVVNGSTMMDLTGDTAEESDVLSGKTFHLRSGAQGTGSMITHDVYNNDDSTSTDDALSANMGRIISEHSKTRSGFIYLGTVNNSNSGTIILNFKAQVPIVIYGFSANTNRMCEYVIFGRGTNSEPMVLEVGTSTTVTHTETAGKMTITSSSSSNTLLYAIVFTPTSSFTSLFTIT